MLGAVETKKCSMFLGCCLEEHEVALVYNSADDQMLECAGPSENSG
jgi:hypothetical protein